MALIFKEVTLDEIKALDGFDEMIAEFKERAAEFAMPHKTFSERYYRKLEEAGRAHGIAVIDDETGKCVGGAAMVNDAGGHFEYTLYSLEAFYLMLAYRSGTNGLKFVDAVREWVTEKGSPGFMVTAPAGSVLDKLSEKFGATHVNNVWWYAGTTQS